MKHGTVLDSDREDGIPEGDYGAQQPIVMHDDGTYRM